MASLTQNSKKQRKEQYKNMSAEGADKEARNRAITSSLGISESFDAKEDKDRDSLKNKIVEARRAEKKAAETAEKTFTSQEAHDLAYSKWLQAKGRLSELQEQREVAKQKLTITQQMNSANVMGGNGKAAKRARLKASKQKKVADHKHAESRCGNPGCQRCFPELYTVAALERRAINIRTNMGKKSFRRLLASTREAGRIARGEQQPSRTYVIKLNPPAPHF